MEDAVTLLVVSNYVVVKKGLNTEQERWMGKEEQILICIQTKYLVDNMKTIAVIIAGGSGHRMGQDIPKQFINVYDKPVKVQGIHRKEIQGRRKTRAVACNF